MGSREFITFLWLKDLEKQVSLSTITLREERDNTHNRKKKNGDLLLPATSLYHNIKAVISCARSKFRSLATIYPISPHHFVDLR